MSNTYAPPRANALDELPWVEVDAVLADAFEEFVAAADKEIMRKSAPKDSGMIVIPRPAFVGSRLSEDGLEAQDDDMCDVLEFKDTAMDMTQAEQETFDALTQRRSPRLAKPLPID
jgi:hypothetical protein